MSANRLAFELREQERASPILLLKAMERPASVFGVPDQKMAG
jgi:hypothetical protein